MEDPFCDQTKAYQTGSTVNDALAVTLYEQYREAIQAVQGTLTHEEKLMVVWHDPAGNAIEVDHLGYYGQTLLVLRGRDGEGLECTALLPAQSAQLVLKKVKRNLDEMSGPFNFMGHSVLPDPHS